MTIVLSTTGDELVVGAKVKAETRKARTPDGASCARCDHRYAVHAGHPGTACVRYEKGQRCPCRGFALVGEVVKITDEDADYDDVGGPYRIPPRVTLRFAGGLEETYDSREQDGTWEVDELALVKETPRCPDCKGEGIVPGTRRGDGSIEQCPSCGGSGVPKLP